MEKPAITGVSTFQASIVKIVARSLPRRSRGNCISRMSKRNNDNHVSVTKRDTREGNRRRGKPKSMENGLRAAAESGTANPFADLEIPRIINQERRETAEISEAASSTAA